MKMHNIVYQGAQIAGSVVVTIFGLGQLSSIFTIASYIADSATTQIHDYIDTRNHGKGAKITYYISRDIKQLKNRYIDGIQSNEPIIDAENW